ncbi:hypothetical protein CGCS363_v015037 [Colletotrichum siamense]|uniref:uncharacterized protein n=1 Tax=Colletotrichum siamense TaxID=690259 RepID=UPI00187281EF|nr:uncharacterized protein CGCS363_v015037 [Colletotrichum siamense]KAF5483067.1 hypothetical protein CGCS363_v015037 [Colletotrichum siamense]
MTGLRGTQQKRQWDGSDDNHDMDAAAPPAAGRRVRARREYQRRIAYQDSSSARERARPYLLAVAKMPIAVLDTTWSVGRNRSINTAHVQELLHMFRSSRLERRAPEKRIIVLCSADEVSRMQQAFGNVEEDEQDEDMKEEEDDDEGDTYPKMSFLRWAEVNGGKAEVMAGQHRIQALREYIKEMGAAGPQPWWTCELYDKDRLPYDLNVELRVNRRDPSLPNSHGETWLMLDLFTSLQRQSNEQQDGGSAIVDETYVKKVHSSSEMYLPTRRLVTLWNNHRWRPILTRWCCTRLGLDTFDISYFEWIASLGIDEYWADALEEVLSTLADLPVDERNHITRADWDKLSGHDAAPNVTNVFFTPEGEQPTRAPRARVDGFLATLDDEAYSLIHNTIRDSQSLAFPDLRRILHCEVTEMKTAVCVLRHVISWISPEHAVAVADASLAFEDKPLLREHLSKALDALALREGWASAVFPALAAVKLQRRVLDFVRDNLAEFRAPNLLPLLDGDATAEGGDGDDDGCSYGQRFNHVAWARLLKLVRQTTDRDGAQIRPSWTTTSATGSTKRQTTVSTLAREFCASVLKLVNHQDVAAMQSARQQVIGIMDSFLALGTNSSAAAAAPSDCPQPPRDNARRKPSQGVPAIITRQSPPPRRRTRQVARKSTGGATPRWRSQEARRQLEQQAEHISNSAEPQQDTPAAIITRQSPPPRRHIRPVARKSTGGATPRWRSQEARRQLEQQAEHVSNSAEPQQDTPATIITRQSPPRHRTRSVARQSTGSKTPQKQPGDSINNPVELSPDAPTNTTRRGFVTKASARKSVR